MGAHPVKDHRAKCMALYDLEFVRRLERGHL